MAAVYFNSRFGTVEWTAGTKDVSVASGSYPVMNITDYNPEQVERVANNQNMGVGTPGPDRPGNAFNRVGFECEIWSAPGTANSTVSALGTLLRMAGFTEGSEGSTPNVGWGYTLSNALAAFGLIGAAGAVDPATLRVNLGANESTGQYVELDNAVMESVIMNWIVGQVPTMAFIARGTVDVDKTTTLTSGATAGAPTAHVATSDPVVPQNITFSYDDGTLAATTDQVFKSINIAVSNIVAPRPSMNDAEGAGFALPRIVGRETITTLVFETDAIASITPTKNFKAEDDVTWSFIHDTAGGVRQKLMVNGISRPVAHTITPGSELIQESTVTMQQSLTASNEIVVQWDGTP